MLESPLHEPASGTVGRCGMSIPICIAHEHANVVHCLRAAPTKCLNPIRSRSEGGLPRQTPSTVEHAHGSLLGLNVSRDAVGLTAESPSYGRHFRCRPNRLGTTCATVGVLADVLILAAMPPSILNEIGIPSELSLNFTTQAALLYQIMRSKEVARDTYKTGALMEH